MNQQKFRKWVKKTLVSNDLTARQLAQKLGISPQNLNNQLLGTGAREKNNERIREALNNLINGQA